MNKFFNNILLSFKIIINPGKYREELVSEASEQGTRLYYSFIFPLILIAGITDALPYYFIDGPKIGFLVAGVSIVSESLLTLFLIYGIGYLLNNANIYSRIFLYSLAFALFWLPMGAIIQVTLDSLFGIYGRILGYWPLKLGAIWLINFCIKEIIFTHVPIDIPRMKMLFNKITAFLVLLVILIPYATEKLISWMVLRIL